MTMIRLESLNSKAVHSEVVTSGSQIVLTYIDSC